VSPVRYELDFYIPEVFFIVTAVKTSNLTKHKALPVTGLGSPKGSETPWLPHFVDRRFTDDGEVVSLAPARRPLSPE
jgi:hypothetical protein